MKTIITALRVPNRVALQFAGWELQCPGHPFNVCEAGPRITKVDLDQSESSLPFTALQLSPQSFRVATQQILGS